MERLQAALILFGVLFAMVFLVDYFLVKRRYLKILNGKKKRRRKKDKKNELLELSYLVGKFKLDEKELNLNKLLIIISLLNGLIISLVSVTVLMININIIVQLVIGFILLFALIYAIYELLGRYLVEKGYGKK